MNFYLNCIFKMGRIRFPKRRLQDNDLPLLSNCPRIGFLLAEAIQEFCAEILNLKFRYRRNIW